MNNPHQALIEEKVAEFKELGVGYEDSIEPILDVLPNIDHPELGTYSFEKWLTQTLQDTIDTVLEGENKRLATRFREMQDRYPEWCLNMVYTDRYMFINTTKYERVEYINPNDRP